MPKSAKFEQWLRRTEAAWQRYLFNKELVGRTKAYNIFYSEIPK